MPHTVHIYCLHSVLLAYWKWFSGIALSRPCVLIPCKDLAKLVIIVTIVLKDHAMRQTCDFMTTKWLILLCISKWYGLNLWVFNRGIDRGVARGRHSTLPRSDWPPPLPPLPISQVYSFFVTHFQPGRLFLHWMDVHLSPIVYYYLFLTVWN